MKNLERLIRRYPQLACCESSICTTIKFLTETFENDCRLYICGNGGSASDALHIAGELAKSFILPRRLDNSFVSRVNDDGLTANLQGALPAVALVENAALATAYSNDCNALFTFAQQVYAYAREGDCVWGISTSGNSANVLMALKTACGRGAKTIGLTGISGGELRELCDACICVPETETYKIQELHLPVYHAICLELEEHFWGDSM